MNTYNRHRFPPTAFSTFDSSLQIFLDAPLQTPQKILRADMLFDPVLKGAYPGVEISEQPDESVVPDAGEGGNS